LHGLNHVGKEYSFSVAVYDKK